MDGTCSMHEGHEKYINHLGENPEDDYLEDVVIDWSIILK
jgi:hypothetical protein